MSNQGRKKSTGCGGWRAERDLEEGQRRHRGHQRSGAETQSDETISRITKLRALSHFHSTGWTSESRKCCNVWRCIFVNCDQTSIVHIFDKYYLTAIRFWNATGTVPYFDTSLRVEGSVFRGECSGSERRLMSAMSSTWFIPFTFKLSARDINNRNNSDISK